MNRSILSRLQPARIILFAGLLLSSACAAVTPQPDAIERSHAFLGRRIADMVDRLDRTIGEPRVEDRQRKVKLVTGCEATFFEGGGSLTKATVNGRLPLPGLERKANLYFDIGGDLETEAEAGAPAIGDAEETYKASLQYLSLHRWPFSSGIKVRFNWDEGPQTTLRPFVRWEKRLDPFRYYVNQEIFYRTNGVFGEKTYGHVDYILGDIGFLRLLSEGTVRDNVGGVQLKHGVMFRQPVGAAGALSYETGIQYNSDRFERGRAYVQLRLISKFLRPWLEFEIRPQGTFPWSGSRDPDYQILAAVNVIFEDFLRREETPGP